SEKTCTIASTCSTSGCRPCASVATTSCCSPTASSRNLRERTAARQSNSPYAQKTRCLPIPGQGTCESCATCSSGRRSCAKGRSSTLSTSRWRSGRMFHHWAPPIWGASSDRPLNKPCAQSTATRQARPDSLGYPAHSCIADSGNTRSTACSVVRRRPTARPKTAFMKAFVFERTGEPNDVLAVRELPKPKPGPDEILVRVRLSPVHPSDMHIMRGRFGRQPTLPASPGIECVGIVEELGSGVAGPAPGTRVVLLNVWGSWRELIVSPAERVIPVPGHLSDEDAAQALVNPVTAWVMIMVEHDLKPADWLVQTAAGSTVGRLVLQLARSERFRTVNIVRCRAENSEIKAIGGEGGISSEDSDWGTALAEA